MMMSIIFKNNIASFKAKFPIEKKLRRLIKKARNMGTPTGVKEKE